MVCLPPQAPSSTGWPTCDTGRPAAVVHRQRHHADKSRVIHLLLPELAPMKAVGEGGPLALHLAAEEASEKQGRAIVPPEHGTSAVLAGW